MITANATQIGNKIRLEIAHPEKGSQVTTVTSQGEAMRVVYFANRAYMISKLTSWLKQRMYGTEPARSQEAAKLLVLLGYYEHLSFRKLCVVIHQHRSAIEGIAPGPKAKIFNYYNNIIVPILNDATEIGG